MQVDRVAIDIRHTNTDSNTSLPAMTSSDCLRLQHLTVLLQLFDCNGTCSDRDNALTVIVIVLSLHCCLQQL